MEDVQNNNNDADDDDDTTTSQEPSSLHWSDPSFGEEFSLSFWIISHFLFRHLSCLRSWRIRTESGSWPSCKRDRRADVFLRRSRSWRSPLSLQRRRRNRAWRRRRRRARPRLLGMLPLRRLSALSRTPAAAAVPLVSRLRESRQQLQQTHSQKSESSRSSFLILTLNEILLSMLSLNMCSVSCHGSCHMWSWKPFQCSQSRACIFKGDLQKKNPKHNEVHGPR